jgi:hypothetical protein
VDQFVIQSPPGADEPGAFERSISEETIERFMAAAGEHDMLIPRPNPPP